MAPVGKQEEINYSECDTKLLRDGCVMREFDSWSCPTPTRRQDNVHGPGCPKFWGVPAEFWFQDCCLGTEITLLLLRYP